MFSPGILGRIRTPSWCDTVCHTVLLGSKVHICGLSKQVYLDTDVIKTKISPKVWCYKVFCLPTQKGLCSLKLAGCKIHIYISFVQPFPEIFARS